MNAVVPFLQAIEDVTGGSLKLPRSEYDQDGRLPVVDQGKSLISGYTNDLSYRFKSEGNHIVFGDHTRAVKYVDFPFAMGADGVKVLSVRSGFDSKYVYHYLRTVRLPDAGYSRHFKFLKEIGIPKPPIDDQRRIAVVLDRADMLYEHRRVVIESLEGLTQAVFYSMFGDLGPSSNGYPVRPLKDWIDPARPITYGILKPGDDVVGGVPYVRVADMKRGGIELGGIRRTTFDIANAYRRSQLVPGDLLVSIRGHVGRFAFVPSELAGGNITQDSARLAVAEPKSAAYVRAALETPRLQQWMLRRTKGAAVRGINLGDLREAPIPFPPLPAQATFAERAKATASNLDTARRQLEVVQKLVVSLQSRVFSCQL